jgi:PIN domain nuclease of toxin-antitoxin system
VGNRNQRALGKLTAPPDLESALAAAGFQPLPITIAHALQTDSLPPHHRDPFDRMLVAQALVEGYTLLSRDPQVRKYNVAVIIA